MKPAKDVLRPSLIQEQLVEFAARLTDGHVHSKFGAYIAHDVLEKRLPCRIAELHLIHGKRRDKAVRVSHGGEPIPDWRPSPMYRVPSYPQVYVRPYRKELACNVS